MTELESRQFCIKWLDLNPMALVHRSGHSHTFRIGCALIEAIAVLDKKKLLYRMRKVGSTIHCLSNVDNILIDLYDSSGTHITVFKI